MTLRLHPENPRYLEFRGAPTVLMTSGEHYGAVLNLDFDYIPYLDELQRCGFNLTRTFSGSYVEIPGSFRIADNTLAPRDGRFICPWARSNVPGGPKGGPKYDLDRWDEAYFDRLKGFVEAASDRGIVIEFVLFCFFYNDDLWQTSPLYAENNIQGVGDVPRNGAYDLANSDLLAVEEALAHKIVDELAPYDNVYYEIMNEPYSYHDGTAFLDWQAHMADVLVEAEAGLTEKHLIAQNYQNRTLRIPEVHEGVSILNIHYAEPSFAHYNYHYALPLGDDETGFKGQAHLPYRQEAWRFMLSGGSIFSHLDYSFTAGHPDGTSALADSTPGWGNREWREQLGVLKRFLDGLPLTRLAPHNEVVQLNWAEGEENQQRPEVHVLGAPGEVYAAYITGGAGRVRLRLGLPRGRYVAAWLDPASGEVLDEVQFSHERGRSTTLESPRFDEDLALRLLGT
jgi:hypothetical protein